MKNHDNTESGQKIKWYDKLINTICFFAVAVNIGMAWSHFFKGNDTIKYILSHIILIFGGLIFYVIFIHKLPRYIKILVGLGVWVLNVYIVFNYDKFMYFIKHKLFAI